MSTIAGLFDALRAVCYTDDARAECVFIKQQHTCVCSTREEHVSTMLYRDVLDRAQELAPAEQLRLLEELARHLRTLGTRERPQSVLELEGLGKEIWSGIDAQEYVDRERSSWNG